MCAIEIEKNKKMIIFLTIAFGLTLIMTIPTIIGFYATGRIILNPGQAFYPAAGFILADLLCEEDYDLLPKRFFFGYLCITGIMTLRFFTAFFMPVTLNGHINSFLSLGVCVALVILYFSEEKDKRVKLKLNNENVKLSFLLLALFSALLFLSRAIASLLLGEFPEMVSSLTLSNLPVFFAIAAATFPMYFGEEYGWRCYFQPTIQQKFGYVKGVFLFGVLWEFWHLPSILFTYGATDSSMSLLQVIVWRFANLIFLAIFMAYLYMRVNNIWAPMFIHVLNNNFFYFIGWESSQHAWKGLAISILINAVLFLPFLLTKQFQIENNSEDINNYK